MNSWVGRVGSQIDVEVLEESALAMAQSTIQNAMEEARVTKSDLADRMDCHRSLVTRMLSGSQNLTVKTMSRALAACGYEVRFQHVPIVWYWGAQAVKPPQKALPAYAGSAMPVADASAGIAVPA
jgi:hypothetical protein